MGINTVKYLLSALLLVSSLTAFSYEHPRRHMLPRSISSKRAAAAKRAKSYTGEKRQLVILASFSDLDFESEDPLALWNQILNQPNYHEGYYQGSVHDYFYSQSYGKFDLQFDLYAFKVNKEHAVYRSTATEDENASMLFEALADSLKNTVTDWAPYDWDEDGYIDQILVIYAGMGQNNGGDKNTIWAHQAYAIVDRRDMVELRHDLVSRRGALRKQVEYNAVNRERAKEEVNDLIRRYPNYAKEIIDIVSEYENR